MTATADLPEHSLAGVLPRHTGHVMALLMLLYGLMAVCFSDRIPENNGLGFDGVIYGQMARDFDGQVLHHRRGACHAARILPSAVVHYSLRAVGLSPRDDANIVLGFQCYNLALLVAGAYLWSGTARRLGLGRRGAWLGFAGLFGSFAVLKFDFYYPVLTDTTALAVGLLLTYAYVRGSRLLLFLGGVAGAFSWSAALYMAGALLLFPRAAARATPASRPIPLPLAAAPAAIATAAAANGYYVAHRAFGRGVEVIWAASAPLALAVLFVYLTCAVRGVVHRDTFGRLLRPYRETTAGCVVGTVALFGLVRLAIRVWLNPIGSMYISGIAEGAFLLSIAKPAVFLVAHAVYYGPIIVAAVLLWPSVAENLRRLGLGAVLAALLGLALGATSESRHLLAFLPLLVLATVQAIERLPLPRSHGVVFVATALVVSKFWLPITGPHFKYLYFSNQGPWMPASAYAIQGVVLLVLLAVFARYYLGGRAAGWANLARFPIRRNVRTAPSMPQEVES